MVLVVPMNPEFFPEMAMLLAGSCAAVFAIRYLVTMQLVRGLGLAVLGVTLITLAVVLGTNIHVHSAYAQHRTEQAEHAR